MSRKRLALLAVAVLAALTATGVAIADAQGSGAQAASATFTATTVSHEHQASCAVNGGDTLQSTTATYTGTATSADARLDGTLTIRARSLVDTATGVGVVRGVYRIVGTGGSGSHGIVDAAVAGTQATGLAEGMVGHPEGRLVASLAATFDPAGGFSSGSLGTGSAAGAGAVVAGAWCHAGHILPLRHDLRKLRRAMHRLHKLRKHR